MVQKSTVSCPFLSTTSGLARTMRVNAFTLSIPQKAFIPSSDWRILSFSRRASSMCLRIRTSALWAS